MAHMKRKKEPSEFEEVTIDIARVMRVTKGGRQLRFRALVVIGDKKSRVGIGMGKAGEVAVAIQKAIFEAKKSLITVKIKNDTIAHEVNKKYKSALVRLLPASEGTGVIAGSAVRVVCELAGIKNILGKSFGSNNKICLATATVKALQDLKTFAPHMN